MRTLIVYATKYGATKKIAEDLGRYFGNAELLNIDDNPEPSIFDYDFVILGSFLTAGMIHKRIKNFAVSHAGELKTKHFGIYVSGLDSRGEAEYFNRNFAPDILSAVKAKAFLGGVFDPEKCGFFACKAIKILTKLNNYTSTIDDEKIKKFAEQLKI